MGSKQCKTVAMVNMGVGAVVVAVVGLTLLMGAVSDTSAIFGFLAGVSNLFYGFTVFRTLGDAEPDESTFYGLRKRSGSSWLVPALMTVAPMVGNKELCAPVLGACVCSVVAAVLLDVCIHNGCHGN